MKRRFYCFTDGIEDQKKEQEAEGEIGGGLLRKRLWTASHSRTRKTWSMGYRKELTSKVGQINEHCNNVKETKPFHAMESKPEIETEALPWGLLVRTISRLSLSSQGREKI